MQVYQLVSVRWYVVNGR